MEDFRVDSARVGAADTRRPAGARKLAKFAAASTLAVIAALSVTSAASAATCQFVGAPQAGAEPPLAVDATCSDPDYNSSTLVIDSTQQLTYTDTSGHVYPYTEVKGHFPARNTVDTLPPGVTDSPTLDQHNITWRFPAVWMNRSFQQTYPIGGAGPADLNEVDLGFAFSNGALTVKVDPGNPRGGYRVNAAATKLAWAYANQLYNNSAPIYSYLWGQSGGSAQALAAAEGVTGVWAGVIPAVIAPTGLIVHSFQWQALYAVAVPIDKRAAVRRAAEVGSGQSIYDPLDAEQRQVLDELLKSGFARLALGTAISADTPVNQVPAGDATVGAVIGPYPGVSGPSVVYGPGGTSVRTLDPTYEDDFWSKPGYAGANPPNYLTAAKVDGYATITQIIRDAQGNPTALQFDPATVPALGSIKDANLEFYVYDANGARVIDYTNPNSPIYSLTGILDPNTGVMDLTVNSNIFTILGFEQDPTSVTRPINSPVLLSALTVGGKVRINNRFFLSQVYYPRYSILKGNPGYDQYLDSTGKPLYPQRAIQWIPTSSYSTMGGIGETGNIKTKVMVMENLEDANSFPYVAAYYAQRVQAVLGKRKTDDMFRVYYQEHWGHSNGGYVQGIFNQMVLDLVAWAERGVVPKPSSTYTIDSMTQIVQPAAAANRLGLQDVINLTANGNPDRMDVSILQPVNLAATIQMPPNTGKIVQFNWSVQSGDLALNSAVTGNFTGGVGSDPGYISEPPTVLASPSASVTVNRAMTFSLPGEYIVNLNASGDRNGASGTATEVKNMDRVRVVVH